MQFARDLGPAFGEAGDFNMGNHPLNIQAGIGINNVANLPEGVNNKGSHVGLNIGDNLRLGPIGASLAAKGANVGLNIGDNLHLGPIGAGAGLAVVNIDHINPAPAPFIAGDDVLHIHAGGVEFAMGKAHIPQPPVQPELVLRISLQGGLSIQNNNITRFEGSFSFLPESTDCTVIIRPGTENLSFTLERDDPQDRQTIIIDSPRTFLIDKGAATASAAIIDNPPIISASYFNDEAEVASLLREGADINTKAINGITPYIAAWRNSCTNVIKLLSGTGADIHAEYSNGQTLINAAISRGNFNQAVNLIMYGARFNDINQESLKQADFTTKLKEAAKKIFDPVLAQYATK